MKNKTTYETGAKLAAAGFPQPAPAPGQWWGDGETLVFIFRAWIDEGHNYLVVSQTVADGRPIIDDYFDARDFRGVVYLPTVGDLLRTEALLGYGASMQYDTTESGVSWVCAPMEWSMPNMVSAYHETSEHEAAALAWLKLHLQKQV